MMNIIAIIFSVQLIKMLYRICVLTMYMYIDRICILTEQALKTLESFKMISDLVQDCLQKSLYLTEHNGH